MWPIGVASAPVQMLSRTLGRSMTECIPDMNAPHKSTYSNYCLRVCVCVCVLFANSSAKHGTHTYVHVVSPVTVI